MRKSVGELIDAFGDTFDNNEMGITRFKGRFSVYYETKKKLRIEHHEDLVIALENMLRFLKEEGIIK